jgi:hypothetical protein
MFDTFKRWASNLWKGAGRVLGFFNPFGKKKVEKSEKLEESTTLLQPGARLDDVPERPKPLTREEQSRLDKAKAAQRKEELRARPRAIAKRREEAQWEDIDAPQPETVMSEEEAKRMAKMLPIIGMLMLASSGKDEGKTKGAYSKKPHKIKKTSFAAKYKRKKKISIKRSQSQG